MTQHATGGNARGWQRSGLHSKRGSPRAWNSGLLTPVHRASGLPRVRATHQHASRHGRMSLPRRPLCPGGPEVSVLGFGGSPLGGVFRDVDEAECIASVHRAFELGINLFDTSPFYGITKAETVLGKALAGLPRDEIVVCTKVGRYGEDVFDFSAERVTASFHESLKRLGVDYVDVLHVHDIEFTEMNQIAYETLPALQKLKEAGLVRYVGITGLPLEVFSMVLNKADAGLVDVILSYCHYCLNDTSLTRLLPELGLHKVGVINASCFSMGLLTKQGPPPWHPAPGVVKEAAASAASAADAMGVDIARLALMWAMKEERISTTLVGMCTVAEVEGNVDAVLQALGLKDNPNAEKENMALERVKGAFGYVQDMSWKSGLPENNHMVSAPASM